MKLDRNIPGNRGRGKYAVIKMRKVAELNRQDVNNALATLESLGVLDYGTVGSEDEFFLIRLKDEFSTPALGAYVDAAEDYDFEYASEVREMETRSGKYSPFCKRPD